MLNWNYVYKNLQIRKKNFKFCVVLIKKPENEIAKGFLIKILPNSIKFY